LIQLDEKNAESEADRGNNDHPTEPAVCFGIDLGGVLCPYIRGEITKESALACGPLEAAQQWVRTLVNRIGPANVHIISKVGRWAEEVWSNVLRDSFFLQNTGVLEQNVHWVRDRTGPFGTAPIAMQLGLTHFVDDGYDVLCDIQTHFRQCQLQLPKLYLVPTARQERGSPNVLFKDMRQAMRDAWQNSQEQPDNSIQCCQGLSAVPLPCPP
jgi:hypothetical protein